MSKTFDLYCAVANDLDAARERVEIALDIKMRRHDSMYWGGKYYLAKATPYGDVAIRPNYNSFTGRLHKQEFPDCRFIVSVDVPPDPDAAKQKLVGGGLLFLKRSVLSATEPAAEHVERRHTQVRRRRARSAA